MAPYETYAAADDKSRASDHRALGDAVVDHQAVARSAEIALVLLLRQFG
jgi:hypothetical protein